MKTFQNKYTKKYYKQVRSCFPLLGKQEKAFLFYLQEILKEFEISHPHYQCDDYYEQFGLPEEIVSSYYEHIESEFIIKRMKARKFIKYASLCFIIVSICVAVYILYTRYQISQEIQDRQIYYEQTTIEVIE